MLKWSLCNILFFLNGFAPISFCTSKTLSPFPSPPWLITFLFPIKINRGHVRHVRSVKFLHVLFSYTRIYITFNSTSPAFYFSFTVSLFVCDHFKGPYSSSERERKFRRCLFTSTIKREIRHFHVVVVQKRERNVKKVWCTCEVVVLLINPIVFFWRSRCCPRPSLRCSRPTHSSKPFV